MSESKEDNQELGNQLATVSPVTRTGQTANMRPLFTVAIIMQIGVNLLNQCNALRMINLDAPQMALQGDTIQLSCSYSLFESLPAPIARKSNLKSTQTSQRTEPELSHLRSSLVAEANERIDSIYAIKWYKDEREFYRYLTKDWPQKQAFATDGLNIDVEKSDNQTVVLRNVSLKASGLFRCEVSTEAPSFLTKSIERKLSIYSLPYEGPVIEQGSKRYNQLYYLGDQLSFRCTTKESKPATQIDWLINERVNLTNHASKILDPDGRPFFQTTIQRIVRLPAPMASQTARQNDYSSPDLAKRISQTSYLAYEIDYTDRLLVARSSDNSAPVLLSADSFNQLPESSTSWLNFTVSSNLLQHLSNVGALKTKILNDRMWTSRKTIATSPSLSSDKPARMSRGNVSSKTRPNSTSINVDRNRRSFNSPLSDRAVFQIQIRCVARVLHLSLSDDIRFKVFNKTREITNEAPLELSEHLSKLARSNRGQYLSSALTVHIRDPF